MTRDFQNWPYLDFIETLEKMASENTKSIYRPEFPEFAIETIRLKSFDDWPEMMKQKPEQMSDAGFFYTQISDRVICFSCGGGLCKWDEQDDPWEQHALWYSKCTYLQLVKGPEFVAEVKKKFDISQKKKSNGNKPSATTSQQKDEHTDEKINNKNNKTMAYGDNTEKTESNDSRSC